MLISYFLSDRMSLRPARLKLKREPSFQYDYYFSHHIGITSEAKYCSNNWLQDVALLIGPGQPLHILFFSGLIIFFSFFYTALMYNPSEVADNLKRGGAYLPGIRPGENTAKYIDEVTTKLTLIGGLYITLICLMPQFLNVYLNVPFYLGGTSLLIAVVVTMDFMAQVQSHLMSREYDSLMKKANLKNVGRK